MRKQYLTPELIQHVLKQSENPIWKIGGILSVFAKNWVSVIKVSPITGLIHFDGNSDTGWKHILDRHNLYSHKNYFGEGAKGNPSKFNSSAIPKYDFVNVSDDVFLYGEKDDKPHPDSSLFDKYKGKSNRYTQSKGVFKSFFLVLYKDTKIVHSVYPSKPLEGNPQKRILKDFARCRNKINVEQEFLNDNFRVSIPYENANHIIRYVIIIIIEKETGIARAHLQVNALDGFELFTTLHPIEYFQISEYNIMPTKKVEALGFFGGITLFEYANLEVVEKAILWFEERIQNQIKSQK